MKLLDNHQLAGQGIRSLPTLAGPKPAPPIVVPNPELPDFVDVPAPSPQDQPLPEPHDIPPPSNYLSDLTLIQNTPEC